MIKDALAKIEIQGDSAVLLISRLDSPDMDEFKKVADTMWLGKNILFIFDPSGHANIEQLDERAMNAAGWFRKENIDEQA